MPTLIDKLTQIPVPGGKRAAKGHILQPSAWDR